MSSTGPRGRGECKYDYDDIEIGGRDGIGDYNHHHNGDIYVDHIHADSDHNVDDIKMMTLMAMMTENDGDTSGRLGEQL